MSLLVDAPAEPAPAPLEEPRAVRWLRRLWPLPAALATGLAARFIDVFPPHFQFGISGVFRCHRCLKCSTGFPERL